MVISAENVIKANKLHGRRFNPLRENEDYQTIK